MTKTKILWIGDGGVHTGFAQVNHSIIENLPADEYEIRHLAVNYRGDWFETAPWHRLYPAMLGGDFLGIGRVASMIKTFKPDMIFILNDLWIMMEFFRAGVMPTDLPIIGYFPVDAGPVDGAWIEHAINRLTVPVAYTEFGKSEVIKREPELEDKLVVLPHGIDKNKFFQIPKGRACALMGNTINPLDWIVFNGNRNQPRKRMDLTIKGFCEFAKDKPSNVKLYLHTGMIDAGFPIDRLMNRYDEGIRLYITAINLNPAAGVTTERLNWIYNCCDVGINTSLGEGWGLVPFEHAATGAPQIVANNSASAEVFADGRGLLMECEEETVSTPKILTEGKKVSVATVVESLQYAYEHPKEMQDQAAAMLDYLDLPEFRWSEIALRWHEIFQKVIS